MRDVIDVDNDKIKQLNNYTQMSHFAKHFENIIKSLKNIK